MDDIVQLSGNGNAAESGRAFSYEMAVSHLTTPKAMFMCLATIEPGETIPPHMHPEGTETILHILSGRVEHRYGKNLEKTMLNQPGDFIFIPGNVPHQPVNLSSTEPVTAIVACNFDISIDGNSIPYAGTP
ncbi:cupin domain-containing protein [Burkholderia stabilis]|uniref:Predicted mannose-6-phosphate isomerase,Cupin domain n=1 Tax=Burkholderia stabilis TaxID=95485 RepID=A0AAJ5NDR1_9BURK|nr:cupin domain-containing protein [Burkholderia stabilis]VBB16543.1 Predicted mannose-6-phosphate isomerase,Cupin domain [Burkholderia stabilis]